MGFFVYILVCADGSYYVGSFRGANPLEREAGHNIGSNPAAYTFHRRPVQLVYSECYDDPADMVKRERQLRGWSRAKKSALIAGDKGALKRAAISQSAPPDSKTSKFRRALDDDAEQR